MKLFEDSKVVQPKNFLAHYESVSKLPEGAVLRPKMGVSYGPFTDRQVTDHTVTYKGMTMDCQKTVYHDGRKLYVILVPNA